MDSNLLTVMITGATSGIGRMLAHEYSGKNSLLILVGRDQSKLEDVRTECIAMGAHVTCYTADLFSTKEALTLSDKISKKYKVDLLISNAGLTNSVGVDKKPEEWGDIERLLGVNLTGAIAVTHFIMLDMQKREQGHVAYVSSLAAYYGMSLTPAYSASKAGLKAYAEAMRVLLKPSSVNVTLITPGFVETPMSEKFNGSKPFMLTSQQAAKKIKYGLDRRVKVITFPLVLSVGMRILPCLPASIADRILALLRY